MSLSLAAHSGEKMLTVAAASGGQSDEEFLVNVKIPDLRVQTFLSQRLDETIWNFKQSVLNTIAAKLVDGLNYGVFCPPANGKAGKFLDEERCWKEYGPFDRHNVEIVYKRRIYKTLTFNARKVKEVNSKAGQKKFISYLKAGNTEKITKLLAKGFDPNFQDSQTGETPFTLAILRKLPREMFMTLVDGGAHLDLRNKAGLTPLHCAAHCGNKVAVQTLLNFGASPNYKDVKGLTPLYHCVCNDTDPDCADLLLREYALHGVTDETGWTEVHQACRYGRHKHLQHLLSYGANMNSRNSSGNTPLHVCAIMKQENCARLLLFRGADKTLTNFSNQDPVAAGIMAGNQSLADIIRNFKPEEAVRLQEAPQYNPKRRTLVWQSQQSTLLRQRKFSHSTPQLNLLRDMPNRPGLPWMDKTPRPGTAQIKEDTPYDSDSPSSTYSDSHDTDSEGSSELTEGPNALYARIVKKEKSKGEMRHETGSLDMLLTNSDSDYQSIRSIRSLSPNAFLYRKKAETESDSKTASIRTYPKRLTTSIFQEGLFEDPAQADVKSTPQKILVPAISLPDGERSSRMSTFTTFGAIDRADSSPNLLLDDTSGHKTSASDRNNLLMSPPPGILRSQKGFGSTSDLLETSNKVPFSGSDRSSDGFTGNKNAPEKIPYTLRTYGSANDLLERDNHVKTFSLNSGGEPNQGTGTLRKPTPSIPDNIKVSGSSNGSINAKAGLDGSRDKQASKLSVPLQLRSYGSTNDLLDTDSPTYLSLPGSEKDQARRYLEPKQLGNSPNVSAVLNRQYGSVDNLSKPDHFQNAGVQSRKKVPPPPPPVRRSHGPLEFHAKEQQKGTSSVSGLSNELLLKFEQQNRTQPSKTFEKETGRQSTYNNNYKGSAGLLPGPPTDLSDTNIPPPLVFSDNSGDLTVVDLPPPPFPDHLGLPSSSAPGTRSSASAPSIINSDLPPPPVLDKDTHHGRPSSVERGNASNLISSTVSNASNDKSDLHASLIAAVLKRRNFAEKGQKDEIEVPEATPKSLNADKSPPAQRKTVISISPGQPKVSTATVSGQRTSSATASGSATVSGLGGSSTTVSGHGLSSNIASDQGGFSATASGHGPSTTADYPMVSGAGKRDSEADFIQQAEMMLQTLRKRDAAKLAQSNVSGTLEVSQAPPPSSSSRSASPAPPPHPSPSPSSTSSSPAPPPPPPLSSLSSPAPPPPTSSSSSSPAPPPPPPPPPPPVPSSSFPVRRSPGHQNPDGSIPSHQSATSTDTHAHAQKPKQPPAPSGGLFGLAEIVAKKALERQQKSPDNGATN